MRVVSVALLLFLLFAAAAECTFSRHSYSFQDRDAISLPASRAFPAGTDELGRDRSVRTSFALLSGLFGACCASALAALTAVALGSLSAFGHRWLSWVLLYAGDLCLTLPWLFLLMLVRASLPLNLTPVTSEAVTFLLLAGLGIPALLRMNHERIRSLARSEWLLQARVAGLGRSQLVRQLWPHVRPLVLVQFLLYVPACLIAEANLGTMGLGVSQPLPSLGNFLADLQNAAMLGGSSLIFLPVLLLISALVALETTLLGVNHEPS